MTAYPAASARSSTTARTAQALAGAGVRWPAAPSGTGWSRSGATVADRRAVVISASGLAYTRYPLVPGHEWSGVIETVGLGVASLEPGQPVIGRHHP